LRWRWKGEEKGFKIGHLKYRDDKIRLRPIRALWYDVGVGKLMMEREEGG